jgi:hypothetical protein
VPSDDLTFYGKAPADISFLMLDPDPTTRITARQMVRKIQIESEGSTYLHRGLKARSCVICRMFLDAPTRTCLYSCYKDFVDLNFPSHPDEALSTEAGATWQEVRNCGFDLICGGRVEERLALLIVEVFLHISSF